MKIYHYTTIKSLALILESQKIRFTRLDLLDDLNEIAGIPKSLKTLFYVSCWTEDNSENLSLWSLYTNMKGIRIEFPKIFFNQHLINKDEYGPCIYSSDIISPIPLEEIITDNYLINNAFWLEDGFFINVEYVENANELKSQSIIMNEESIDVENIKNLLRFKDSIWKFQNESRFYLMATPLITLTKYRGFKKIEKIKQIAIGLKPNYHNFIDVTINKNVLDNIKIRLHPNCDYAEKVIVRALLDKFTLKGTIEESNLNGIYRNK